MNPFQAPVRLGRLQIEITTGCNLKCAGCQRTIAMARNDWQNRHMAVATFAAVLDHCPPADVLVLQGIGEPTLHPDLPALIALARQSGKAGAISFNTNALVRDVAYYQELRRAGLGHVSVSVDSFDQQVADRARTGTDVGQLRRMLAGLVGSGLGLTVSVVVSRWNLDGLAELLAELVRLAVPVIELQPLIAYDGGPDGVALEADDLARALAVIRAAQRAHPATHILPAPALTPNGGKCRRPLHAAYVTVEGLLTPCCVTNDTGLFGRASVVDRDFAVAWNADAVAGWFGRYLDGEPEICRGCAFNPSGSFARTAPPVRLEQARQLQQAGRLDEAATILHSVIAGGGAAEALHLLGVLRFQQGRAAEALPLLEAAVALAPEPRARHNLAVVLQAGGRLEEARRHLEALIAQAPELPSAYLTLAGLLERLNERPAAADILLRLAERALAAGHQNYIRLAVGRLLERADTGADQRARLLLLAHRLRLGGMAEIALQIFDRVQALEPDDVGLPLARCMAGLPMIYDSVAEAEACRRRYADALADFCGRVERATPDQLARGAAQVGMAKPFALSYQGEDDTALQRAYGRAISRLMQARFPAWSTCSASVTNGRKLKIGFATFYWHFHSVSKLFGGWVRGLDRSRFAVYGYNFNPPPLDDWGQSLAGSCDVFREAPAAGDATEHWAGTIAADGLDALIYLEIGMETTAVRLAALRLAPIQAMTWGHPVTSGLPHVDYFLSSELMEPDDGDRHYTEQLIRLPGLSVCYRPLPPAEGSLGRADLGLDAAAIVFVCCQFLPKYRPADDAMLVRIAAEVPGSQFLFVGDAAAPATVALRRRLEAAFRAGGVNPDNRLVFAAPVPPAGFPLLLALGDIYLDTPAWSGGNTSLEAATAGLPMVTLAGRFMRGRHTTGILTALGLEEMVARTEDEYVVLAVRLARDEPWRRRIAGRTLAALPSLMNDPRPVRALESWLAEAVARGAATP